MIPEYLSHDVGDTGHLSGRLVEYLGSACPRGKRKTPEPTTTKNGKLNAKILQN